MVHSLITDVNTDSHNKAKNKQANIKKENKLNRHLATACTKDEYQPAKHLKRYKLIG